MNYTIEEIVDGRAKIVWSDDSWTYLELSTDMTADDIDHAVFNMVPPHLKSGNGAPSFLSTGDRTASRSEITFEDTRPAWQIARTEAYGNWENQLEYITENGLDAWQAHVAEIKANNPKT